jgi:hypothetical protein
MTEKPMPIFFVTDRQGRKRTVRAHAFTVGTTGSLEFWRITEHGRALIMGIAHNCWATCEEQE